MSLFSDVLCRNLFRTVCVLIRTRLIFPRINGAILSVMTETGIEDGLRKLDTNLRLENSSQGDSTTISDFPLLLEICQRKSRVLLVDGELPL